MSNKPLKEVLILTGIILVTFFVGLKVQRLIDTNSALNEELAKARAEVVYIEPREVEDYIRYVFGPDADKAFLLLKGRGEGECAENRGLNWDAQNYNWDGSVDVGIFQINSKWQRIDPKWLYNWRVNVLIAKQLFDESGSFKLWTCGKHYGI